MSKRKGQSDADICMAISGNDDMEHAGGLSIVEDYFKREREENARESGLPLRIKVPCADGTHVMMDHNPDVGRNEREMEAWKHESWIATMEQERTNREDMEYPHDWENDFGISLPVSNVTDTV